MVRSRCKRFESHSSYGVGNAVAGYRTLPTELVGTIPQRYRRKLLPGGVSFASLRGSRRRRHVNNLARPGIVQLLAGFLLYRAGIGFQRFDLVGVAVIFFLHA